MHSYLNDLQYTVCQESFLRSSLTEALVLIVFNLNTQKQVVQRLRKEVETFKAENANGAKVSIASLLGLNNNNHITNNNETKLKTGNDFTTKSSKEDYEEIVRNGDILSPTRNPAPTKWVLSSSLEQFVAVDNASVICIKSFIGFVVLRERPSSVETISGEDDVIEVSMDENSNEKSEKEEPEACKVESTEKINFLNNLGLITTKTCAELQNKRAERKRRSTANPQFVYSNLEVPTVNVKQFLIMVLIEAPRRVLTSVIFILETKTTLVPAIWKCSANSSNDCSYEWPIATTCKSCATNKIYVTTNVKDSDEIFDSGSKVQYATEHSSECNWKQSFPQ